MKAGSRAVGIAESFHDDRTTLAGCVTTAGGSVDGFVFSSATVGGLDATDCIVEMLERLDREDLQYVLVAGIAPAWFNILDLEAIAERHDLPVLSVSFEESDGLEAAIGREFDGEAAARRLECYRVQPPRRPVDLGGETVFLRAVGLDPDAAAEVVRSFTKEGGRPEPLRVARLAARAADEYVREPSA